MPSVATLFERLEGEHPRFSNPDMTVGSYMMQTQQQVMHIELAAKEYAKVTRGSLLRRAVSAVSPLKPSELEEHIAEAEEQFVRLVAAIESTQPALEDMQEYRFALERQSVEDSYAIEDHKEEIGSLEGKIERVDKQREKVRTDAGRDAELKAIDLRQKAHGYRADIENLHYEIRGRALRIQNSKRLIDHLDQLTQGLGAILHMGQITAVDQHAEIQLVKQGTQSYEFGMKVLGYCRQLQVAVHQMKKDYQPYEDVMNGRNKGYVPLSRDLPKLGSVDPLEAQELARTMAYGD